MDTPLPPMPDPASNHAQALADAVSRWRLDLSRVGDRDALLHYEDLPTGTLDLATAHPGGLAQFLAGRPTRLSSFFREPAAHAAARRSARAIRSTVSQLADEHGLDAGRLAVGMVQWRPPGQGDVVAPVLLRPLVLRPRGAGQTDDDLDLGDQVLVNPALVRLLARHGVFVDPAELVALSRGEHGFAPRPALDRLRDLTAGVPGLVVADRTVVGAFVDLAPSLVADLDRVAPRLAEHPVLVALAHGRALRPGAAARPRDAHSPAHSPDLFDLDPDQRAVVDAVLGGASLCVHAAPGTGSTQVVAALVAALAGQGRRTLLVAPARTELDDVRHRLASLGLAGLLHEPGADRRAAPQGQAGSTAVPARSREASARGLEQARARLVDRHRALHGRHRPGAVSVSRAVDELTRLSSADPAPSTTVRLPHRVQVGLGASQRQAAAADLLEASQLGAFSREARDSPWYGATLGDEDEARLLVETAQRLHSDALPDLRTTMARLAADVGLSGASTVTEWRRQVELLVGVRSTLDVLTPAVYERSVVDLVTATASSTWRAERGLKMSGLERRRWRRQAADLVRPGSSPPDLHAALLRAQAERLAWQRASAGGGWPRVPAGLAAADAALDGVARDLVDLDRALGTTPPGAGLLDASLDELAARLARLAGDPAAADRVPRRAAVLGRLRSLGMADLLDDLLARGVGAGQVADELELAWWASVLAGALADDPALGSADEPGEDLVAAVGRLREAEVARVLDVGAAQPLPPCTVISPLALPQQPAEPRSDVVVLAGAHRWGVAEATLAIARGHQVVVVGDTGGLPPSVIRLGPEDPAADDAPASAMTSARTSLLDAASGVLDVRSLVRQHRMPAQLAALRDLVADVPADAPSAGARPGARAVPAPDDAGTLELDLLPDGTGVPDADGAIESLDVEVEHVVHAVLEHARTRPGQSLAVVAVGRRHARRIAEALRAELPDHPDVAPFFTRPPAEPFVVTDLSRCEDAVRDAVVLTTGFGRTPHGRVLHRFGVLDAPDGARLLAVGLTRARHRLRIVSCLGADDLDPERLRTPGAVALRAVLGAATDDATPAEPAPTPLLADLGARLEGAGLQVRTGAGGLDLVVTTSDGGRATAVLTDGADVGDDVDTLVEREVSLPAALRRLGWRVVRVGTLALFTDPGGQVARVRAAVEAP